MVGLLKLLVVSSTYLALIFQSLKESSYISPFEYATIGVFPLRQGIIYTHSLGSSIGQKRLNPIR